MKFIFFPLKGFSNEKFLILMFIKFYLFQDFLKSFLSALKTRELKVLLYISFEKLLIRFNKSWWFKIWDYKLWVIQFYILIFRIAKTKTIKQATF